MKSNQRREEAGQLIQRSKQVQKPLRKLLELKEEDANRGSAGVSYRLLLTRARYLNEQKIGNSKKMINHQLDRNNHSSAIYNEASLRQHHQVNDSNDNNLEYFNQTMYNLTTIQSKSKRRYASVPLASKRRTSQTMGPSRIISESLSYVNRPSLSFVFIALALSSCISVTQIQALQATASETSDASSSSSSSSLQSPSPSTSSLSSSQSLASSVASSALSSLSSAIISAALQDGKSSSSDRSNSPTANGGSETAPLASSTSSAGSPLSPSPSSSSDSASIAASLSSAVASAAAAAAVAAAQNSLSGSDARSLLTGSSSSSHHHTNHQSRNPGLNLALKLADAIPEVPYNILHNMKKLDHAAPFYNVGNKVSHSGNSKESSHGFLSSALHASGGLGGAAEQLSTLFRSPIWKRIADGYGEFTSEFRSLFRMPPTTMKGPTSSTTKLLRDLSVPALLMILASTIPSDWRPVRTRRKSLMPSDLAPAYPLVDPMTESASSDLPNYSPTPQLFGSTPNLNMALQHYQQQPQIISQQQQQQIGRGLNPLAQMYNQLMQPAAIPNQARTNDINLQQADSASTVTWMQPNQPVAQSEPASQMHNYETQMHQIQLQQLHPQQHQFHQQTHQQSIRRFGDYLPSTTNAASVGDSTKSQQIHSDVKPVSGRLHSNDLSASSTSSSLPANSLLHSTAGSLFSSLTSGLVNQVGHSKLMNRIMNANTASSGSDNLQLVNSYKMTAPARRDHLSDKHRYSLVDNDTDNMRSGNNLNAQQQQQQQTSSSAQTKPFLISAMTQALGSMLANSPLKSGSTSSLGGSGLNGAISSKMFTLNGDNDNYNHHNQQQNSFSGDKTINHHDTILRRNYQASPGVMEQRELSKLIPQSWREVVKRTVNSVQEQATTQWRSIEGQLTNWVQDKLKTFPVATGTVSSGPGSSSSSGSSSASAPVSNIFATVGSTALNILGLGGKSMNGASNASSVAVAPSSGEVLTATTSDEPAITSVLKNKNDSASKAKQPIAKVALAGVANMIANTLANRQAPSTSASKSKTSITSSIGDTSSSNANVSQYPTLTGVQLGAAQSTSSLSPSSSSSLVDFAPSTKASGTVSSVAGM